MNQTPFQPLHPTLKKCKCGQIFTRTQLYKHFDLQQSICKDLGTSFFSEHGEVPLKVDDPALRLDVQLEKFI